MLDQRIPLSNSRHVLNMVFISFGISLHRWQFVYFTFYSASISVWLLGELNSSLPVSQNENPKSWMYF